MPTETQKRDIFFFTFKGAAPNSTLDQITLPPKMGLAPNRGHLAYQFGEWLKREGHDWTFVSDDELCRLSCDYFNKWRGPDDGPARRFDRIASESELPKSFRLAVN